MSQSFPKVEMSPISSPRSWARKVRRMILQRARLGPAGHELDLLGHGQGRELLAHEEPGTDYENVKIISLFKHQFLF
jgi:hypothetical protein